MVKKGQFVVLPMCLHCMKILNKFNSILDIFIATVHRVCSSSSMRYETILSMPRHALPISYAMYVKGIELNLEAISLLFCVKNKIAKEIHSIKSRTVLL